MLNPSVIYTYTVILLWVMNLIRKSNYMSECKPRLAEYRKLFKSQVCTHMDLAIWIVLWKTARSHSYSFENVADGAMLTAELSQQKVNDYATTEEW